MEDNNNVVFKLFCDVQSKKEPMNGEPEQFLCCSHFLLRAENKKQFTEMEKNVWFKNEVTSELGLNNYWTLFPNAQKEHIIISV